MHCALPYTRAKRLKQDSQRSEIWALEIRTHCLRCVARLILASSLAQEFLLRVSRLQPREGTLTRPMAYAKIFEGTQAPRKGLLMGRRTLIRRFASVIKT